MPGRQQSQVSIQAARKWAFTEEDGEVAAALKTGMIEDHVDDQITAKGRTDEGTCPDRHERGERGPDAAHGEARPPTTSASPYACSH